MKAIKIFMVLLFAVTLQTFGQAGYQSFAVDTIKGDTLITTATVNVPYNGFITWDYTFTGLHAGDTAYVVFQGSNNSWTTWQTISTTTLIQGTTAANQHLIDNPAQYLRYRLYKRAYEIDTTVFTNKLFIYKR